MKKQRTFYAFFCAFAVILLCIPSVQASTVSDATLYDNGTGLGFGPGSTSLASSGSAEASQSTPADSAASSQQPADASSSTSSSQPTAEQIAQQEQQN